MAGAAGKPSWLILEELLERGDVSFVDAIRRFDDAERLAGFAARWYGDQRPASRRLLLEYLHRPLNAFRHEPLVKRIFKLGEAAGDDEVMARFLVLFDRSVRRVKRRRYQHRNATARTLDEARRIMAEWEAAGAEYVRESEWSGTHHIWGRWFTEHPFVPPGTTMPRGQMRHYRNPRTGERISIPDYIELLGRADGGGPAASTLTPAMRQKLLRYRLFSVHTRNYLRRRAWRYFRRLGKQQPERYVPAIVQALKLYEDADVADGLALLDNWGLIHALFHHSPALAAEPHGWTLAADHSLAELAPAPFCEPLWQQTPAALVELLKEARCRPVRQWAMRMIKKVGTAVLSKLPLSELLGLLAHQDEEVVLLAAEVLKGVPGLDQVPLDRWLELLKTTNLTALGAVCELVTQHVPPDRVTLEQAIEAASSRSTPVAKLGLAWLQGKQPTTEAECIALLRLIEAPAEPWRGALVRYVRNVLGESPWFREEWVLEYLDCRHADVRAEGWAWMQEDTRVRDSVSLWRKLLESPHDDVRLKLVAELERRVQKRQPVLIDNVPLEQELLRLLWASVLLNIHRGGRAKPLVVQQLVHRLSARPEEASLLLPVLAAALRSVRGPEWRAGLAGVVQWASQRPEMEATLQTAFPELKLHVA
jgi:hypothetical protein